MRGDLTAGVFHVKQFRTSTASLPEEQIVSMQSMQTACERRFEMATMVRNRRFECLPERRCLPKFVEQQHSADDPVMP